VEGVALSSPARTKPPATQARKIQDIFNADNITFYHAYFYNLFFLWKLKTLQLLTSKYIVVTVYKLWIIYILHVYIIQIICNFIDSSMIILLYCMNEYTCYKYCS
jgi:hypothetical protein